MSIQYSCRSCGSSAQPGDGIWLGVGWTHGWSAPYPLCHGCIARTHGVRIGPSTVVPEEFGLFAVKSFPSGAFIVPYCGEEVCVQTLRERYGVNSAPCGAFLKEGFSVDAHDRYRHGLGRYANDIRPFSSEEENNARILNFTVGPPSDPDQVTWPGLYARLDIAPGSEITIAYGKDYWDVWFSRLQSA